MTRTVGDALGGVDEGTALVRRALATLGPDEDAWGASSLLPGWSRKQVLAHLHGNARALRNLVAWARTSVPTPMYTSPQQREADIAAGAALPIAELVAAFDASADALAADWADLADEAWSAEVVTGQGRTVPASETAWLRAREVMVHAVDLDAGVTVEDLPTALHVALVDDIVGRRSAGGNPAVDLSPSDHPATWRVTGQGDPIIVTGPLAHLSAWLAGRPARGLTTSDGGPAPTLPPWL